MLPACRRSDYSSGTETSSLSLPAPASLRRYRLLHVFPRWPESLSGHEEPPSSQPGLREPEGRPREPGRTRGQPRLGCTYPPHPPTPVNPRRPPDTITAHFSCSFCADQRGVLYGGLHGGGSMVAMGRAGLLGHSFGGYGFPSPGTAGTSEGKSG